VSLPLKINFIPLTKVNMVNVTILSTLSGSISNFCSHSKENFLLSIPIYSEKFTVVSIKIEYSIGRRVAHRVFFNSMSYRFVLRLGSGIGISDVEISGIFESL
jgi:hypothetical protein